MTTWRKQFCCGYRHRAPATQPFKNVLDGFNQRGAITNQLMTPSGARMVNGARYRIDLAPLFGSQPGGDQGTAGNAGLDHQDAQ